MRLLVLGLLLASATGITLGLALHAGRDLLLWSRVGLFAVLAAALVVHQARRAPEAAGPLCRSCARPFAGTPFCLHCGTYPKAAAP